MRGRLVAPLVGMVTASAVVLPAAPATTAMAEPDRPPATVLRPAPPAPDLRGPRVEGCTVPVTSRPLPACPGTPDRPPVSCILPVGELPPGVLVPACPRRDPSPEGHVVPVVPLSR